MIRAYLSHPIRGILGDDATNESMNINNDQAKVTGNLIRAGIPDLQVYIPAEHDDFLLKNGVTPVNMVEELLALDCAIAHDCDLILIYDHQFKLGHGMQREYDYALANNIPMVVFNSFNSDVLLDIERAINKVTN
ncbi:hypothetical protein LCGC14_2645410 [marine sediment metagenome]|uniref:Uncharacterized protein n=1 Tax=marine sediment metagenome TaxID=412755 RepID=A0A0F9CNG5_9ZZZZ